MIDAIVKLDIMKKLDMASEMIREAAAMAKQEGVSLADDEMDEGLSYVRYALQDAGFELTEDKYHNEL